MAKQRANAYLPGALRVRRASLETDHVTPQAKFGGVLDGDRALFGADLSREDVEQGGLAGTRATGHEEVHPCLHRLPEQGRPLFGDATGRLQSL